MAPVSWRGLFPRPGSCRGPGEDTIELLDSLNSWTTRQGRGIDSPPGSCPGPADIAWNPPAAVGV